MKKKTSFRMIARRIIPGILALWLLTIILVTLNNTAYIRDILYDSSAAFTDYLCERQLAPYFTEGDPRYGVQYDNTSIYEYDMLSTVLDCSLISGKTASISWQSRQHSEIIYYRLYSVPYPMETAAVLYDASGKILFSTDDDILYFSYLTQEEWETFDDSWPELLAKTGWIDFGKETVGDASLMTAIRQLFSEKLPVNTTNGLLRVRGYFEGNRLVPANVDYVSYDTPSRQTYHIKEARDLDLKNELVWRKVYESPDVSPEQSLKTYYLVYPYTWIHSEKKVTLDGKTYPSLVSLLKGLDIPSGGNVVFDPMNPSLYRIKYGLFSGLLMVNARLLSDPEQPLPEEKESSENRAVYIITAEKSSPLLCAVKGLGRIYLITFAAACLLAAILLFIVKRHLTDPVDKMITAMEEDSWNTDPPIKDTAVLWPEGMRLKKLFETLQRNTLENSRQITRLNTALDYARNAEEKRREMTSGMAHELKTPLAVIRSYAEGLKEHINENKRDHYIDVILKETDRTNEMVLSMLELSRLEAGRVTVSAEDFSLKELTEEVLEQFGKLAEEKNLTVSLDPGENFLTSADKALIRRVIENLVSNAVKYTENGGSIRCRIRHKDGKSCFSIENDCEPLSEDALTKVWDSFYRADASRSQKGTGIGLSIVKSIILLHGGTLSVKNTDTGVEFGFTL